MNKSLAKAAGLAIPLIALIFYFTKLNFAVSGDSILYGDLAKGLNTTFLTLHIGYYVFIHLIYLSTSALVDSTIFELMVWVNAVLASIFLYVFHSFAKELTKSDVVAASATLILAVSGKFFLNATEAETYMLQTLCLLTALWLAWKEYPVSSGIFAAASALVSPLSFFTAPAFIYIAASRRFSAATMIKFLAAALVLYTPVFLYIYDELLWGSRGLIKIDAAVGSDYRGLLGFPKYLVKHYFLLCPFIAAGFLLSFKLNRNVFYLSLCTILPNLYITLKIAGEDQAQILIVDIFFAVFAAIGLIEMLRYLRSKSENVSLNAIGYLSIFALFCCSTFVVTGTVTANSRNYRPDLVRLHNDVIKDREDSVLLTSWRDKIAYEYFNGLSTGTDYGIEVPVAVFDLNALTAESIEALNKSGSVFVLESYQPSRITALLASEDQLQRLYRENSYKSRAEELLGRTCVDIDGYYFGGCIIESSDSN